MRAKKLFNMTILILSMSLLSCNSSLTSETESTDTANIEKVRGVFTASGIENITISPQTMIERKIRRAAVKITDPARRGHGSGSYFMYRGLKLVITAYHVVDQMNPRDIVVVGRDDESVRARLIYKDEQNDIAVLQPVRALSSRVPMPLNILQDEPEINSILIYTGFPSGHDLLTFQGNLAGFEDIPGMNRRSMIVHTYGWFGSSGSCLFNSRGKLVGILWGVDVERFTMPQAQEDLIYASFANLIDMDAVLAEACTEKRDRPICQMLEMQDIQRRFSED